MFPICFRELPYFQSITCICAKVVNDISLGWLLRTFFETILIEYQNVVQGHLTNP